MIGTGTAAALNVHLRMVSHELLLSMLDVAQHLTDKTPLEALLQGIPAGFLVASVAWIRAGTTGGHFWIILTLTYAIALGGFTHVVAGAAKSFLLLFAGRISAAMPWAA